MLLLRSGRVLKAIAAPRGTTPFPLLSSRSGLSASSDIFFSHALRQMVPDYIRIVRSNAKFRGGTTA